VEVVGSAPGSSAASTRQDSTTGKTATLASAEPGSPINIRQSASIDASVQEVAHSGDAIQVSSKTQGSDGYTWYKVSLESGASGWVRSDLINSSGDSTVSRTTTDSAASSTVSATSSPAASTTASPEASPTASPEASTIASTPPTSTRSASSSTTSTASSGRSATIASKDSDSPINVRSGAGTDAEVQDIAYGGDRIQITETKQGDDGQTWYKVQFESGSSGWVRSDFIEN
jgi:uncharacterized protein YgiM (DUF1202 family)